MSYNFTDQRVGLDELANEYSEHVPNNASFLSTPKFCHKLDREWIEYSFRGSKYTYWLELLKLLRLTIDLKVMSVIALYWFLY